LGGDLGGVARMLCAMIYPWFKALLYLQRESLCYVRHIMNRQLVAFQTLQYN